MTFVLRGENFFLCLYATVCENTHYFITFLDFLLSLCGCAHSYKYIYKYIYIYIYDENNYLIEILIVSSRCCLSASDVNLYFSIKKYIGGKDCIRSRSC